MIRVAPVKLAVVAPSEFRNLNVLAGAAGARVNRK
jgi:hypothetical protein